MPSGYAFDQRGIEIPFPHRTLYWGDQVPSMRLLGENGRSESRERPPTQSSRQ